MGLTKERDAPYLGRFSGLLLLRMILAESAARAPNVWQGILHSFIYDAIFTVSSGEGANVFAIEVMHSSAVNK